MSDRDASISCLACSADNRSHRGYCRGCGAALAPVCRGCRFINDRGDRFCGGCGLGLRDQLGRSASDSFTEPPPLTNAAPTAAAPARSSAAGLPDLVGLPRAAKPPAAPASAALLTGQDELAALLAPLAAAKPADELPSAGITQADLDRLFGGTS